MAWAEPLAGESGAAATAIGEAKNSNFPTHTTAKPKRNGPRRSRKTRYDAVPSRSNEPPE
jgi:hypothetical protein